MYIFIGNLPGTATLVELHDFLGDHEMSVDFSAHRHHVHDDQHFVLIKTASDEDADQLVRELDGREFLGMPVEARRWVERRDTRVWTGPERRFQQLDLELVFNPD